MSKIIEFFGPPGSGKTTIANHTLSYLRKRNISAIGLEESRYKGFKKWISDSRSSSTRNRVLKKIIEALPKSLGNKLIASDLFVGRYIYEQDLINRFIRKDPGLFILLNEKIENIYCSSEAAVILRCFERDLASYQNSIDYIEEKFTVLEEGFCQSMLHPTFSLMKTSKLPPGYKKDIKELTKGISSHIDYAFFVSADPEVCDQRQKTRGKYIHDFQGKTGKSRRIKSLETNLKDADLIHSILNKNGVPCFKIDNNDSLSRVEDDMSDILEKFIPELQDQTN